jgi:hypothetical protein
MARCLAQLSHWGVSRRSADGGLPAPGVYGLPDPWPHVRAAYQHAGFTHTGPIDPSWPRPGSPS